ncbi:hypothetical protein LINGRAHAP2_LOCUS2305 [Linum grandiflorum]
MELFTTRHLLRLLRCKWSVFFSLKLLVLIGLFINLILRMHSFMGSLKKQCIWNARLDMMLALIQFVCCADLSIV